MNAPSAWSIIRGDRGGRLGLAVLGVLVFVAIFAPLALPDPRAQPDLGSGGLLAPGAGHWLGTDRLNRDILSRVVHGARISLAVAAGAVALSVTIGTLVGLLAGYLGGWVDAIIMRTVDAAIAIPRLFLLLIMVAIMERIPLGTLILVLGVTGWFGTSRLIRGEVLRLRTMSYVRAAEALGAKRRRVILGHLLPNVIGPLSAATTLAVGDVILLESGLSYLGLGVQPPWPSWGGMILDASSYVARAPWASVAPGVAIIIAVLAVNLVGEALHRAYTPRTA